MIRCAGWLMALALCCPAAATGSPPGAGCAPASGPPSAVDPDEAPDLALLEYLGGLVAQDGEWIGPEDMEALPAKRAEETEESARACAEKAAADSRAQEAR